MSAPKKWSKKDTADVSVTAKYARYHAKRAGADVLDAVISDFRSLAVWRRKDAESHRATAARYRSHLHDEAMGQRFDTAAARRARDAVRFDRIADRLAAGDLPPGVFWDDEVGP